MPVGNYTMPGEFLDTCTNGLFYCMSSWANSVTNGTFWIFALLAFCVICFSALAKLGTNKAFGFASFVGLIGSVWFAVLGLISWWIATIFILVGVIGIAALILSEK